MNKLKVLLALCLSVIGTTAFATAGDKVTTLEGISSDKVYTIACARGAWSAGSTNVTPATLNDADANQWFIIEKDDDNEGKYYFKVYSTSKYLTLALTDGAVANKTLFSYSDSKETSCTMTASTNNADYPFYIKYSDDRVLNNNGQSSMYFDTWTAVDAGNSWAITEVGDLSSMTFLAALSSVSSACSETVGVPFGRTTAAQEALKTVYNQYSSYSSTNLPEDVSAATTALTEALSTYNSSAVQELTDGTQAILGNQQHTSLYVRAKETNRNSVSGGWLGSYGNKDNYRYLFTFKKNTDGTWKMYSDYYGKYVGAVPSANNLEFQLVDESSACNFTIEASSTVGYGVIYDATCTTTSGSVVVKALHMTDWTSNGITGNGVVRWGVDANASHFKFITDLDETLTAWNKTLTDEAAKTGTVIGTYENTEALQNALTAFNNAAQTEKGVKAKALEEALAAAAIVPEAGAYYTITNANQTSNLICEDYANQTNSNNNAAATTLDANNAPYLWQFEAVSNYMDKFNNLYKVKAANSGNYLSKSQWAYGTVNLLASSNSNVGSYDFFDKAWTTGSNTCTFTYWTDEAHSDRGTMTANSGATTLSSWNAANSGLNNWTITKVTTIPVTISEAKYATLKLPFAVTLPAEGLKAYKGTTDEENYLSLTEITGIIPANEPVILTGEAATYTLTISSSTDAASTDNVLSGTLTPATLTSDNTAYILKNGTSGVGLYKVTSTSDLTIPANKAYLLETSGSSQSMKGFRFDDGTTTGIHSAATTNTAADEFYDLNGRRVLFPVKGVYVKGNGQKVYIK